MRNGFPGTLRLVARDDNDGHSVFGRRTYETPEYGVLWLSDIDQSETTCS